MAHDDDAVTFSGTTSLLAANGWEVDFVCFYTNLHRPEDNPTRKREMKNVAAIQGLHNMDLIDFAMAKAKSEQGCLKKYIPYYHFYPGWIYFGIFRYEYFNIL